jgi:hypothetical protein
MSMTEGYLANDYGTETQMSDDLSDQLAYAKAERDLARSGARVRQR